MITNDLIDPDNILTVNTWNLTNDNNSIYSFNKVGINTTNPSSELDVNGDVNISGTLNNNTRTLSQFAAGSGASSTLTNDAFWWSSICTVQKMGIQSIYLHQIQHTAVGLTFTFIWTGTAGDRTFNLVTSF